MASGPPSADGTSDNSGTADAAWDLAPPEPPSEMLHVDLGAFEGPLDLLLALARMQKLDLAAISMRALVDQYLAYIDRSDGMRLDAAGDFLVMAAWLTFLKTRLLLPKDKTPDGGPTGDELASRLAFRLQRLDAMRSAAATLLTRRRFGRDVFGRGMPEQPTSIRTTAHTASLYDLLKAYADNRVRTISHVHVVRPRTVWSIKDARRRIEQMLGTGAEPRAGAGEWVQLDLFMDQFVVSPEARRSVIASGFGASLELAREGRIDLEQDGPFTPLFLRRREITVVPDGRPGLSTGAG